MNKNPSPVWKTQVAKMSLLCGRCGGKINRCDKYYQEFLGKTENRAEHVKCNTLEPFKHL